MAKELTPKIENKLKKRLEERQQTNSLRTLTLAKPENVDFFSNDYLGLSCQPDLIQEITNDYQGLTSQDIGATGSRLLSGNNILIEETEKELAKTLKVEATLLFNSGYNANLSILSVVPQRGDLILYDSLIHASLKDAYRLSFADRKSFKHNNIEHLRQLLERFRDKYKEIFIVVESIYSMDGDQVDLSKLVPISKEFGANIILDEAHSTGIIGENGAGLAVQKNYHQDIFARIHTFGKGIGAHGACIAGSDTLIQCMINFARPFIYTTALPSHSILTIRNAFRYLKQHSELQEQLEIIINHYQKIFSPLGKAFYTSSPIQTIPIGEVNQCKKIAKILNEKGFELRPILSPTVPKGTERLRICLHTYNTPSQINSLYQTIAQLL